jgi:hypothetical protein
VRTVRGAIGIGTLAVLLGALLVPGAARAQSTHLSVGLGVGLFDGVSFGVAFNRWSAGSHAGVSVATGVAAVPTGAYGIYSSGYGGAYYDVPAYCQDVYHWIDDPWYYGGGQAWWAWGDGWGHYDGYWRSAWYRECILGGPSHAYHAFHAANFFRRSYRPWNRYRTGVFVYWRDPFVNPWGPYWTYEPVWAVAGGTWGRPRTVIVHRPDRVVVRTGTGGQSPLYRPGVGYKESPVGPARTAVPRRTNVADSRTPANVRAPTGGAAPRPANTAVRPGAASPTRGPEAIRTRPSQARPSAQPSTRPGTRPATQPATRPTARPATAPASRPTARGGDGARPTAPVRGTPTARTSPPDRGGAVTPSRPTDRAPAARPAPSTSRPGPTARSTPSARPAPATRSAPAARPQARSAPAARPAPAGRPAPAARSAPAPRTAPTVRSAPATRSAPASGKTRPPATRRGGGGGG